jgi:hypothetical protein
VQYAGGTESHLFGRALQADIRSGYPDFDLVRAPIEEAFRDFEIKAVLARALSRLLQIGTKISRRGGADKRINGMDSPIFEEHSLTAQ